MNSNLFDLQSKAAVIFRGGINKELE